MESGSPETFFFEKHGSGLFIFSQMADLDEFRQNLRIECETKQAAVSAAQSISQLTQDAAAKAKWAEVAQAGLATIPKGSTDVVDRCLAQVHAFQTASNAAPTDVREFSCHLRDVVFASQQNELKHFGQNPPKPAPFCSPFQRPSSAPVQHPRSSAPVQPYQPPSILSSAPVPVQDAYRYVFPFRCPHPFWIIQSPPDARCRKCQAPVF